MTRDAGSLITAALFTVLAIVLLIASFRYQATAAFVPIVVAIPTVLMFLDQLVREARRKAPASTDAAVDLAGRERATLLWMAALLGLVWAAGVVIALPAYLLLYLRVRSRERWIVAAGVAGVAWAILFLGLGWLLESPPPPGIIWTWLTRS
jgi:hypothetical protein